jgi:Xaa-Pro aminopeptidase
MTCLALPAFACIAVAQFDYPVYETDKTPAAEMAARREAVRKEMTPGSIAFFFTNATMNRNNDVDFLFRADSNFLYLSGFEEPDAVLVLAPDGFKVGDATTKEALFVNVANANSITWLGYRMGPENAVKLLGIQTARPNSECNLN